MLHSLTGLRKFHVRAADGDIGEVTDGYFDDERWVMRLTRRWAWGATPVVIPPATGLAPGARLPDEPEGGPAPSAAGPRRGLPVRGRLLGGPLSGGRHAQLAAGKARASALSAIRLLELRLTRRAMRECDRRGACDHLRQNAGVASTITLKISSRPRSIATVQIQVWYGVSA